MDFQTAVFYFLSAILVFAGLRVITARNPVHAALHLILAFFTCGGIWALLQAEFLAIAIILVYVGAVMVLFLFVVMMLDINMDRIRQGFWSYLPLGALLGLLMALEMSLVLGSKYFQIPAADALVPAGVSNTKSIGALMFRLCLSVRIGVSHPARWHDRGDRADLSRSEEVQVYQPEPAGLRQGEGSRPRPADAG
jgi:NADH-quinone oxidoreductase subunit J